MSVDLAKAGIHGLVRVISTTQTVLEDTTQTVGLYGLLKRLSSHAARPSAIFDNIKIEKIYTAVLKLVSLADFEASTTLGEFCRSSLNIVFSVANLARKWHS